MSAEGQRIQPLPNDEWDDDIVALVTQQWTPGQKPPENYQPPNLFTTLARNRELFRTWSAFGYEVFNGPLTVRDREFIILRVAWRLQCRFEWAHHEDLGINCGMTDKEFRFVFEGPESEGIGEYDKLLLTVVEEFHHDGHITDATWDALSQHFDTEQLVYIPALIGEYTLVAYMANALRIRPDDVMPQLDSARKRLTPSG
jgi:4-carboxymuconolactone decarboxylase